MLLRLDLSVSGSRDATWAEGKALLPRVHRGGDDVAGRAPGRAGGAVSAAV